MFTDNDDDGENAAGGRLAHLLQILVGSLPTPSPGNLSNFKRNLTVSSLLSHGTLVEFTLDQIDSSTSTMQHVVHWTLEAS